MGKIKIHYLIFAGFVLGIISPLVIKDVSPKIKIIYQKDGQIQSSTIHSWKSVYIITYSKPNFFDTIYVRNPRHLLTNLRSNKNKIYEIKINSRSYLDIVDVSINKNINYYIQPLGILFLRLLSFLSIPLVISSLIAGVASIGNLKDLGKIGLRTIFFYVITTIIAISIGLIVANVISPGKKISDAKRLELFEANKEEIQTKIDQKVEFDFLNFLVEIVPSNPFRAISNGEMLQIIFFALFLGIGLTLLPNEKSQFLQKFFDSISDVFVVLVKIVLFFAPVGVFSLIFSTIYDFGIDIILTLLWYVISVVTGYSLHFFVVYSLLLIVARKSPKEFYNGMKDAFIVAFSSSSSAATLPVTIKCVEENLKVPKKIASFVLPLGATINMDGTSIFQGVASIFIAQVYGIELNFMQQLTIIITALMASIGTSPVPGVGLIMLVMVLQSVSIPIEGIALILGVDRILDMLRTILNVSGDAIVSLCVARFENNFQNGYKI